MVNAWALPQPNAYDRARMRRAGYSSVSSYGAGNYTSQPASSGGQQSACHHRSEDAPHKTGRNRQKVWAQRALSARSWQNIQKPAAGATAPKPVRKSVMEPSLNRRILTWNCSSINQRKAAVEILGIDIRGFRHERLALPTVKRSAYRRARPCGYAGR